MELETAGEQQPQEAPQELEQPQSPEAEEATQAAEPEEEQSTEPELVTWDPKSLNYDDPSTFPEPLQHAHKNMLRGFHQQMGKAAAIIKEYEAKMEALNAGQKPEKTDDGPPLPTQEHDYETAMKMMMQRARWEARQEAAQMIKKPQEDVQNISQELLRQQQLNWVDKIKAQPGCTEQVWQKMVELEREDPMWHEVALQSYENLHKLYRLAKLDVDETTQVKQEKQRKQTAANRAVSKPTSGAVRDATTQKDYGGSSYQEVARKALEEQGISPGAVLE